MSTTTRITVRLTTEQLAFLQQLGEGDSSRGVRKLLWNRGIGPIDLPRGMAAVDGETRSRVSSSGGAAKNRKV